MSHRNPGVGGHRHRGADPRHDLERHAGLRESQRLLAPTSEHERVAPLEADHEAAALGLLDQQRVDLRLGQAVRPRVLAREDPERAGWRLVEQHRVDQTIVDDHPGAPQHLEPAHRHEAGIAGPGADQIDAPGSDHADSRLRARCARA